MSQLEKRIKHDFRAVFGASNSTPDVCSNVPAICSGAIEQILVFNATHSFKNFATLGCIAIVPQSPQNTQANRGLFGASFAAINPQSTISAQASRGFSAVGFETAIGGAA